ncbi:MAG TPA: hypothetical protein VNI78_02250 [Vicinamibacterales bacterium]|nr:hypothetical protein [Vicinamibacterales bacterium]
MATRTKSISKLETFGDDVRVVSWTGLTQASTDDGEPLEMPGWADRSVQVLGTLGVGGSVRIEGSNVASPGVNDWAPLTDPQGNALDINSLKIEAVTELTRWIRPRITAGDGTTNLAVHLLIRRS